MLSAGTALWVAGIVVLAGTVQRAVGFGFALLAVPLMAFVVPTKSAVVVVFLSGALSSVWLAGRLHRRIEWPTAGRLGVGAVLGAPLGVVILRVVSATALRAALGVLICAAAAWIIVSSRLAPGRSAPRPARTVILGLLSGVLNTALATSGPPLVYELRRAGFGDDDFRATISAVFVLANLIGLPLLVAAGLVTALDVELAAVALVPALAGIALGSVVGRRMTPGHFLWAVDLLLLATGVLTVVKAFG
ncbi:MAG TPA: sulfite exporter TauE/SafE family protein [Acidimicrobiales bacterium]|nr:sulfite exporter TauE/SafE family protein [Acidimicrobiales bacterium]